MAVFKCKMCGGDLNITAGQTVCECECCGTSQTVPVLDDEKKMQLFARANRLRFNCEFDKAAGVYEGIVADYPEEAEAYWGIILCKYGIEYVDDPATGKKVPTCHRSSFSSVFDDDAFGMVMENSDTLAKSVYRADAKQIEELRKSIVEVSAKEEPYDIFICYKETDDNGNRTVDSVIAQDVYDAITEKGYRVFFSRITLEDKLGVEYEPYIFAALNSAKVMLAFGTKYEYYDAVWVKNEWSRFLKIIAQDRNKYLIPCFKDIDAYDMPKEFVKLQSQDMGKVGAIQDLMRGIEKIIPLQKAEKETVVVRETQVSAGTATLLERAFMFLEDGKWQEADEYCEKVLDQEPKNASAYLGKLMAELKVKTEGGLKDAANPFDALDNCQKACRFDAALAENLKADNEYIRERNEIARKDAIYDSAIAKMTDDDSSTYKEAITAFETIIDWKDSRTKIAECKKWIEEIRIAEEKAESERNLRTEEARAAAEAAKAKIIKLVKIISPIVAVIIVFLIVLNSVIIPASNYKKAVAAVDAGNYSYAYSTFYKYADYKDTQEQISLAKVKEATALLDAKKYDEAYKILKEIGNTEKINESMYARATALLETRDYDSAYALLEQLGDTSAINESIYNRAKEFETSGDKLSAYLLYVQISEYKDSNSKITKYKSIYTKSLLKKANVGDKVIFGTYEQDNNTSNGKEEIEWRVLAKENNRILIISEKALDCKPYNTEYTDITWETCSLRKWLNGTFYKAAFDSSKQSMIKSAKVTADANPNWDINPGNATNDKVFLLSITEVNMYFSSDEDRKCVPTAYAIENGVWAYSRSSNAKDSEIPCMWWLRSPGSYSFCAAYDSYDGNVQCLGGGVQADGVGVRPALWIDIE